jgi:hypothetical protein
LLAEYPALSREEAEMVLEAERIVASQELERLEHDLILITLENASRYDAPFIAALKAVAT